LLGQGEIVLVFGKREVTGFGAGGVGKARERCRGIANHFAIKVSGNFSSGKGHIGICVVAVDLVNATYYKGARIQFNP
jgi:hypothetical protein